MASIDRYVSAQADINVKRSKFPLRRRTLMSYFHGYLQPVGSPIEVLPGDTFSKVQMSVFTRMSTPILPFVDNVRQECDVFFVPKRILWNKTKQFYGEAPSFGIATPVFEPTRVITQGVAALNTNLLKSESIAGAFGLVHDGTGAPALNILPIRAFFAVYNEYYRNENYQDQYSWDKEATGLTSVLAYINGTAQTGLSLLPKVNKDKDLFTSILPYQIKGNPVALSIGGKVPVITGDVNTDLATELTNHYQLKTGVKPLLFGNYQSGDAFIGSYLMKLQYGDATNYAVKGSISEKNSEGVNSEHLNNLAEISPINLYADLGSSVSASISDLLYSLAYQDFLSRCAHFGTRYKEYIFGMFGTRIADATEDIPEYLGRLKFNINVQQVVQTTGFQADPSTELGALGAYSNSGKSGEMFTKSFTEPGYVVFVSYTKHQRTYTSGIDRVFLKSELLDYYQPPFANIADVPISSNSIWLDVEANETPLGFQEPWWDYRSLEDRAYGMMNAKLDAMGQLWTLADVYSVKPTIGAQFMMEDRDAIARVLATGTNGPDYIMDFQLEIEATRVMPLYASGKLGRF